MSDDRYRIEDVRKNALYFYGVDIRLKKGNYYLDFPDGVSEVVPVSRSFGEDEVDTIALKIKEYKGTKILKLSGDSLSAIHYNLSSNPTGEIGKKVAVSIFMVALVGFALFTLVEFNVITGLVVGDVLIDSSGWQVWVGLVIAVVAGFFAIRMFRKKNLN
jgi:hypothetical protein